ncbi:hypothetical protein PILCRDRAFT_810638 [Piloderma croceum F 1598]|uniref:Uncharacterized protein n=1 Tax=Piloderma croceum (strain F 1598) TaxID=765440 RepID=A0A0C3G526_PILCF|nr:hypothetical protein PILCRDRAFT_810638 [Piloderma croceum F 1598]
MPSMNRLYVDLIYEGSDKFANYDPPSGPLDVGTYGVVTRDGNFLPHGNIYSDKFKASYKPDVAILAPVKRANEECIKFQSSYVRSLQAAVKAKAYASSPIGVALEGSYELSKRAAAALIMHNAIVTEIPQESHENIARIMEHEELQEKVVVEKAYACDAYYYFVRKASMAGMKVNFSLGADAYADGKVGGGWTSEGDGGVARFSGRAGGPHVYFPIYSLKCLNNQRFFSKNVPAIRFRTGAIPSEPLVNFELPWDILDDEGDEMLDTEEN